VIASTLHSIHALPVVYPLPAQALVHTHRSRDIQNDHPAHGHGSVAAISCYGPGLKMDTGTKFVLLTTLSDQSADSMLQKVYETYADAVMKNPFQTPEMPIRTEAFDIASHPFWLRGDSLIEPGHQRAHGWHMAIVQHVPRALMRVHSLGSTTREHVVCLEPVLMALISRGTSPPTLSKEAPLQMRVSVIRDGYPIYCTSCHRHDLPCFTRGEWNGTSPVHFPMGVEPIAAISSCRKSRR